MRRKSLMEWLEDRRLLSVGAAVAAGPLYAGATYVTEKISNATQKVTQTETYTVVGPSTFNGSTGIAVQFTIRAGARTISGTRYVGLDPTSGYVDLGLTEFRTDAGSNTNAIERSSNSPAAVNAPPALFAGVAAGPFSWTTNRSDTFEPGGITSIRSQSFALTETLKSDTPTPVTVPAGTFDCYEIDATETIMVSGGTPQTGRVTVFVARGVGIVESVAAGFTTKLSLANPATQLAFKSSPAAGTVDGALTPSITVVARDSNGALVGTDDSAVTLSVAGGDSGALLGGPQTVPLSGGVATFNNVVFTAAGSYSLTATDGTLKPATSGVISVAAAGAPTQLKIGSAPSAGAPGAPLGLVVDVADAGGSTVTTDASKVAVAVVSGPAGATLLGKAAVAAVNGVATFSSLAVSAPGTYVLQISNGALPVVTTGPFTAAPVPALPNFTADVVEFEANADSLRGALKSLIRDLTAGVPAGSAGRGHALLLLNQFRAEEVAFEALLAADFGGVAADAGTATEGAALAAFSSDRAVGRAGLQAESTALGAVIARRPDLFGVDAAVAADESAVAAVWATLRADFKKLKAIAAAPN